MLPDGQGSHPHGHVHVDSVSTHAPAGAIIVPDAHLLFTGDFKRSGVDLVLSADDRKLVLHDYFKGETRAALASPDGAHLTGDIVNALSGYTQFAQADGSASVAQVIGHVTKLTGTATVIRNGVSIILNQGDNVNKGDVVQSGSNSSLGITFIDGSVFGLASNAKMVLNEMIYDPNGSNNSSLISLVQGTISFVAGATAKHGDMKVDTPVATMGIRGTAVLVEIDFEVPGQGGAPPAKFQVLVEPDGTTGSYILFDKTTLTPIATVNQAGTQTIVNGQGTVSFLSSAQLSADAQKIITDVFAQKYTDNTNPKDTTHFTDSIVPQTTFGTLGTGQVIPVIVQVGSVPDKLDTSGPSGPTDTVHHIDQAPDVATHSGAFTEHAGITHSAAIDTISNTINFGDINAGDRPTAKASFDSFKYENALHDDVTALLTAEQLAAIQAVAIPLSVVQDPANNNNGSATWTYSIADSAFDFLGVGETLTLTYMAEVDNNYAPNDQKTSKTFTITITGTNDAPTIATSGGAITERIGTGNTAVDTASGTVTFTDADLSDRPIVSAAISSSDPFRYLDAQGHDVTGSLTPEQQAAILAVKVPLTVVQAAGNTHNGSATWTYSIADKSFDFLAKGETLTLNYVARVDDGHGGVVETPITVSINGADISVTGTNDIPTIATTSNAFAERSNPNQPNPSGSTALDTVTGTINFTDVDLTDRPVASAAFTSFTYTDALGHPLTLTALQQNDVAAVAVPLSVTQAAGNTNNGSASWTYSIADGAFDFLGTGEILTLTYTATVDDGHSGVITKPFTITVTGTNDTPVITSGPQTASITELSDVTNVSTPDQAHGTITFTDLDLTDTHAVTIAGVSASGVTSGLPLNNATVLGWLKLGTLTDSGNGVTGSDAWTFSAADRSFDYLADGEQVTLTYIVRVDDHHGGVVTQPVTITITGSNDAPAVAADISGAAGSSLHAIQERPNTANDASPDTADGVLAFTDVDLSDTHTVGQSKPAFGWLDAHGNPLTLSMTQQGALTAASALTLTPHDSAATGFGSVDFHYSAADKSFDFLAADQTLTITYDITVFDQHHVASSQPVTITVTGTNDAPVAGSDVGYVTEAGNDAGDNVLAGVVAATGNVLANDTDIDLTDTHSVIGVASGALTGTVGTAIKGIYGSLTLDADGSWTYTLDNTNPLTNALAQGVHVNDVFSYTETDHNGGTSTATLTIDVTGTDDAPHAVADLNTGAAVTEQGVKPLNAPFAGVDTASGNVLSNDTDVDTGDSKTVQGVVQGAPTGPVTGQVATSVAGTYGSVTIGADGSWTYTLDNNKLATEALTQGQQATDVFTYTMHDATGATASATLTIDVTGANDAPHAVADVNTGVVTEQGVYPGNSPFAGLDTASGNVLSNDTDVDAGDSKTVQGVASGTPSGAVTGQVATSVAGTYGSVTIADDGTWTYTLDNSNAATQALMQDQHVSDVFTYTMHDAHGATSSATLTIDVTGSNDAPVITSDAAAASGAVTQGSNVDDSGNVGTSGALSFTDAELADSHTATVVFTSSHSDTHLPGFAEGATHVGIFAIDPWVTETPGSGSLGWSFTLADDDELLQALGYGQTITETYTVSFEDDHGGIVTQPVTVTIHGVNDAPTITSGAQTGSISEIADAYGSTTADQASGTINFADLDVTDTHAMTITGVVASGITSGLPDNATLLNWLKLGPLTDSGNGAVGSDSWTFSAPDHYFDYLAADVTATLSYTVQLDDHHGGLVTQPVTVIITGSHDPGDDTTNAIPGTERDDVLVSTAANDLMTGLAGNDQFVFNTTDGNTGHDVIADFVPGQDKISLDYAAFTATGANDFSHWLASHAVAAGNDVFIDLNPGGSHPNQDTILLKNLTMANLHASDFILPSGGG